MIVWLEIRFGTLFPTFAILATMTYWQASQNQQHQNYEWHYQNADLHQGNWDYYGNWDYTGNQCGNGYYYNNAIGESAEWQYDEDG